MVLVKVQLVHEVHEVIDGQCLTGIGHVQNGPFTNVFSIVLLFVEVLRIFCLVPMEPEMIHIFLVVLQDITTWFKFSYQLILYKAKALLDMIN